MAVTIETAGRPARDPVDEILSPAAAAAQCLNEGYAAGTPGYRSCVNGYTS